MNVNKFINLEGREEVTMNTGLIRTTLCYNDEIMMCKFVAKQGMVIPLHQHLAAQNGIILSGKMVFRTKNGLEFIASPMDSYVFDSNEIHGGECLEDAVFIENFTPTRDDYKL